MAPKLAAIDKNTPQPLRLLQIGDIGSGKSTRAADATRWGRVYFFDFDGKIKVLAESPRLTNEQKDLIDYDSFDDIILAFKKADDLLKDCPYTTIVVDTLSVFNDMLEARAMTIGKIPPTGKLGHDGWGYVRNMYIDFVMGKLFKLPCNIILNCHLGKTKDAEERDIFGPAARGSGINAIERKFTDTQFLTRIGPDKHKVCIKSVKVPTNSYVPPQFVDALGNLTVNDLSVFDGRVMTEKK